MRDVALSSGRERLRVRASCVWCRREGLTSFVVGLAFEPADDAQASQLRKLFAPAASPLLIPLCGDAPAPDESDKRRAA